MPDTDEWNNEGALKEELERIISTSNYAPGLIMHLDPHDGLNNIPIQHVPTDNSYPFFHDGYFPNNGHVKSYQWVRELWSYAFQSIKERALYLMQKYTRR